MGGSTELRAALSLPQILQKLLPKAPQFQPLLFLPLPYETTSSSCKAP